jgi:ABC-type Fe3+/spermidine/putrescine transport system ATPase subunit
MVMSDRIALLRMGELEQVASPREIYTRPATAYCAQFIGHTNLLRAAVRSHMARFGSLLWPTTVPDGPALFSLRPEHIRLATSGSSGVRFQATVRRQVFQGATELLLVECDDGTLLTVRTSGQQLPGRKSEFEFTAADAVLVRESPERA